MIRVAVTNSPPNQAHDDKQTRMTKARSFSWWRWWWVRNDEEDDFGGDRITIAPYTALHLWPGARGVINDFKIGVINKKARLQERWWTALSTKPSVNRVLQPDCLHSRRLSGDQPRRRYHHLQSKYRRGFVKICDLVFVEFLENKKKVFLFCHQDNGNPLVAGHFLGFDAISLYWSLFAENLEWFGRTLSLRCCFCCDGGGG